MHVSKELVEFVPTDEQEYEEIIEEYEEEILIQEGARWCRQGPIFRKVW